MSLNPRELRALTATEQSLSASAPDLASLLAMFNRLAEGEAMPVRRPSRRRLPREAPARGIRPRRDVRGYPHAPQRRTLQRFSQMCLVLWVAVSAALVALAVTLSGYGPRACPGSRAAAACCQAQHPAASARCHPL